MVRYLISKQLQEESTEFGHSEKQSAKAEEVGREGFHFDYLISCVKMLNVLQNEQSSLGAQGCTGQPHYASGLCFKASLIFPP